MEYCPNDSKINLFVKDSPSSPLFLPPVVHCDENVADQLNQEVPIAFLGLAEKIFGAQML